MMTQFLWPNNSDAWTGRSLPLGHCSKLSTDDINAVHAHMSSMFCRHDLHIEGGVPPIQFRHNHAALRSVSYNATDYGNPYGRVIVAIPPMEELYLVQFSLAGRAEITLGNDTFILSQGEMCVLSPCSRVRQVFDEGYKHFTVKIPRAEIEGVLARELGFRPGTSISCRAPSRWRAPLPRSPG